MTARLLENSIGLSKLIARLFRPILEMTKWEYRVLDVAGEEYEDIEATLNGLGAEGWELVCTTETEESVCTLWLKRQRW